GMPSGILEFPDISVVYSRYAALMDLSADVGGWLLLYAGLDCEGVAVAKAALRAGVCDFLVNDLSESLRILKNEIRKRQAVSVVLTVDRETAVAEMIKRGVQPDVLAFAVPEMVERGARVLAGKAPDGLIPLSWSVEREPMHWLPILDGLAVSALEVKDARVRWLEASPRYLGRAFMSQRFVWMTKRE